ncbi:MAG: hypothetical protein ACYTEO_15220 [Planctomycetota bacterium]
MHIQDFAVTTKIKSNWSSATVSCDISIAGGSSDSRETVRLNAELIDPSGVGAGKKDEEIRLDKRSKTARLSFQIDKPKLWNAESPRLYYEVLVRVARHSLRLASEISYDHEAVFVRIVKRIQ